MKKYKLIKWYPSLRTYYKEGDILTTNSIGSYDKSTDCFKTYISPIEVENNPEFWEEIIEKDYQILSFRCEGNSFTTLRENGFYISDRASEEFIKYNTGATEEEMFVIHDKDDLEIYSIKRLSDGKIFTIGDKVDYIHKSHYSPWKIDNFFITKGNLIARSESNLICEYIKDLKHVRPLFVTKDNISKYTGDRYYYIVENDRGIIPYAWEILIDTVTWENPLKPPLGKIQFHNLEKAEQYIEENKPIYSKKDMLNFGKYVGSNLCFTNPEKLLVETSELDKGTINIEDEN